MRLGIRLVSALVGLAALAAPAAAQTELIALDKVHQLLASNQSRLAARELNAVSVEFRNEIGRCRDEKIGAKLMELEPKVDALRNRLVAGTVGVKELEREFVVIDRLLAENHQQLAAGGWDLRRFGRLEGVARELSLTARYVQRAAKWSGTPLSAEAEKAVTDALAVSERLAASPANPPGETGAVIEALGKVVKAP